MTCSYTVSSDEFDCENPFNLDDFYKDYPYSDVCYPKKLDIMGTEDTALLVDGD